jgi:hypothetical protein
MYVVQPVLLPNQKRMSSTALSFFTIGTGIVLGSFYFPMKQSYERDKERDRARINELEEEVFRLKREMRICGILGRNTEFEDSKITPGK